MKKITSSEELKEAIRELEMRIVDERRAVKDQLHLFRESLRPASIIKSSVKSLMSSSDLKGNILTTVISIAAGYLSKKVVFGSTINPIKKLAGALMQVGVAKTISNNKDSIITIGKTLLKRFSRKKKEEKVSLDAVDL